MAHPKKASVRAAGSLVAVAIDWRHRCDPLLVAGPLGPAMGVALSTLNGGYIHVRHPRRVAVVRGLAVVVILLSVQTEIRDRLATILSTDECSSIRLEEGEAHSQPRESPRISQLPGPYIRSK